MDEKLSNEQIIKLIGLYRSHGLLWDMNSKAYRRNDLKVKAYDEIAKEMDMSAEVVKKKIRSLRSTYTGEKKKIYKKSGSATEENFVSSLFWFNDMNFLDNSIAIRNSLDNSKENSENSECIDDLVEDCTTNENNENFYNKKTSKRPRKKEPSKFDEALDKLMDINAKENEFTSFASSLAFQLQKLPEEDAYELMGEFQNSIIQRKLKNMRERRFYPISSGANGWHPHHSLDNSTDCSTFVMPNNNTSVKCSSTPLKTSDKCSSTPFSDILSCAISEADIDFINE